jgi:hypothetical protein
MPEKEEESDHAPHVPLQCGGKEEGAGEIARAPALKMEPSDAPRFQDPQPQEANKYAASPTYMMSEIERLSDEIHAATAKLIALLGSQSGWDQAVAARHPRFPAHQMMIAAHHAMCAAHEAMFAAFGYALGG